MKFPEKVKEIVERFERNLDAYKRGHYKESQLRSEFIDPFFKALGWDVYNEKGYAEAYKEVIHEDAIKVGWGTKAPDYSFRIGGVRKFFVEAKKPSVDIKGDIHPAFQLRRYAWSAKLPLSILTDFEEFAVYDTRIKPDKNDKASKARVMYFTFEEYLDRWDDIHSIFSKDAILKGSFDKYVESKKTKRGTAQVDDAFLLEIESWREIVAKNISPRNKQLSTRVLNEVVQKTVDRIIFLRICEDRGIENYGQLMTLLNGTNVYSRLGKLFQRADERYNSGLFYFNQEKGRQAPDEVSLQLTIDDKPLKDIIKRLYYPESPYEFSVLPADILGQVYERFLGKVIRTTPTHRAVVEEKPEVRKAGGVYYTPTYIVDYIVKNTVAKLLENKTPNKVSKLTILDPACGSGSFLIGAYQYLLDWHLKQYTKNDPERYTKGRFPKLRQTRHADWRLTTSEKKRILLNNIYGVDIDPQAVEVTKLSLLLKVLEGETDETLTSQLKLFHERALPDLGENIKCGNSLIGSDFYEGKQLSILTEEEMYRINAFDWEKEFQDIFNRKDAKDAERGFDAVIGNPPYVDIKGMPEKDVHYIFNSYPSSNNRINLFATFIEKCLRIVNSSSFRFSMIIPTALLTQSSYRELRKKILENFQINTIVRLPNELFGNLIGDVKVDTMIIGINNKIDQNPKIEIIGYKGYNRILKIEPNTAQVYGFIQQKFWSKSEDFIWSINSTEEDKKILYKCEQDSIPFEDCAEFSLGLTPYDKYKGHTQEQIANKVYHADYKKDDSFKKLLAGNDVMRYRVQWNGSKWISYGPWLGAPREKKFFTEKRILVKQIIDWTTKRIWASIEEKELYNTQNAFNILPNTGYNHEYLLGILNSSLMTFYHRKKFLDEFKMRFQKILIKDCRRFPIHKIDFNNKKDRSCYDKIIKLVDRMLDLNKRLPTIKTPHDREVLKWQIDATDRQIDRFVYELYELTEEEIRIVEGEEL